MNSEELSQILKSMQEMMAAAVASQSQKSPTINYNFNAPVGNQIHHVDKLITNFDRDMEMTVTELTPSTDEASSSLPAESPLFSEQAKPLWIKAKSHGIVDSNFKPLVSLKKASIFASVMADKLQLKPQWAPFEELWDCPQIVKYFSQSASCHYYPALLKEYKALLEVP